MRKLRDAQSFIATSGLMGLYIVRAGQKPIVKIGRAKNIPKRIASLQTASWEQLKLYQAFFSSDARAIAMLEQRAHRLLKAHRLRGEWFYVRPSEAVSVILGAAERGRIGIVDLEAIYAGRTGCVSDDVPIDASKISDLNAVDAMQCPALSRHCPVLRIEC